MTRIVTTDYRYKRPRKRKAVALVEVPAIVPRASKRSLQAAVAPPANAMRRRLGIAWICLLCLTATAGKSVADSTFEPNIDRYGSDYRHLDLARPVPDSCMKACLGDRKCRAWSYVRPEDTGGKFARCWLKNAVPPATVDECCTSGVIQ